MSSIIYVVPWAICDTESIYVKKVASDTVPQPEKGLEIDDWCIRNVMPNPDKRSKDIYAIVDVYNGYDSSKAEKGLSVFSLSNSIEKLAEYGYVKATETETEFIRSRVLGKGKKSKKK